MLWKQISLMLICDIQQEKDYWHKVITAMISVQMFSCQKSLNEPKNQALFFR